MSRKVLLYLALAVVVVGGLVVGVAVTRAQTGGTLPAMKASQVLANVAAKAHSVRAVSGDFAWTNNLVPGSDLAAMAGRNSTPTGLSSLATGGKGRLWVQGGSVRLEAQGQSGDLTIVAGKNGLWTYTSANNTVTQYTLPSTSSGATTEPSSKPSGLPEPAASAVDPLAAITDGISRLAPTASVTMSGQHTVAGHAAYIITLKPASSITTFGSAEVAIDGKTFMPLRVRIFARGHAKPVLSAGFTSVSYGSIAQKVFTFSLPKGASLKHQALKAPQGLGAFMNPGAAGAGKATANGPFAHGLKALSLAQARTQAAQAGLTLGVPASVPSSLPFEGAVVLPAPKGSGATAVLHYGKGFSSVVVVEHKGTLSASQQSGGLQKQLGSLSALVTTVNIGSAHGNLLATPLLSIVEWQQSGVTYVAAGMIPRDTLTALAASVH